MAIDVDEMIEQGMTADEIRDIRDKVENKPYRKQGRYGNVARRTEYNGVMYDSKAEASQACELDVEMQQGRIAWWIRQVTIALGPDFKTRVDFLVCVRWNYIHDLPGVYAVEVKGVEAREFKKVRKLWPKYGPFPLHIVKRGDVEIIKGKQ